MPFEINDSLELEKAIALEDRVYRRITSLTLSIKEAKEIHKKTISKLKLYRTHLMNERKTIRKSIGKFNKLKEVKND